MAARATRRISASEETRERRVRFEWAVAPRTIWLMAGVAALFVVTWIVLTQAMYVFILLFTGIVIAEGIRPLVEWLHARHLPRSLAVLLVYLGLVIILAGLGWLISGALVAQISVLSAHLPSYLRRVGDLVSTIRHAVGQNSLLSNALASLQSTLTGAAGGLFTRLLNVPLLLVRSLFSAFIVLVVAFFWLTGVEELEPLFVSVFPGHLQPRVRAMIADAGPRLGGYTRGVAIDMVVVGTLSGLAVWLLGVPYPLVLGVIAGLTELIPYFGPWIGGSVAVAVALLAGSPIIALIVAGVYLVIQEIEGHALVPFVMMRSVKINPFVVVIAVLLGTTLLGVAGGILAVPAAVLVDIILQQAIVPVARDAADDAPKRPYQRPWFWRRSADARSADAPPRRQSDRPLVGADEPDREGRAADA